MKKTTTSLQQVVWYCKLTFKRWETISLRQKRGLCSTKQQLFRELHWKGWMSSRDLEIKYKISTISQNLRSVIKQHQLLPTNLHISIYPGTTVILGYIVLFNKITTRYYNRERCWFTNRPYSSYTDEWYLTWVWVTCLIEKHWRLWSGMLNE